MRRVPTRLMMVRSLLAGSLAASMAVGTAAAHECLIYSRSDTGDLAAGSHSRAWLTVGTTADLFGFIYSELGDDFGLAPLTPSQLEWAVTAARAAGMPNQFTIFVGKHTIAEGTPAMARHAGDGRGVDHLTGWLPLALEIYGEALAH